MHTVHCPLQLLLQEELPEDYAAVLTHESVQPPMHVPLQFLQAALTSHVYGATCVRNTVIAVITAVARFTPSLDCYFKRLCLLSLFIKILLCFGITTRVASLVASSATRAITTTAGTTAITTCALTITFSLTASVTR